MAAVTSKFTFATRPIWERETITAFFPDQRGKKHVYGWQFIPYPTKHNEAALVTYNGRGGNICGVIIPEDDHFVLRYAHLSDGLRDRRILVRTRSEAEREACLFMSFHVNRMPEPHLPTQERG